MHDSWAQYHYSHLHDSIMNEQACIASNSRAAIDDVLRARTPARIAKGRGKREASDVSGVLCTILNSKDGSIIMSHCSPEVLKTAPFKNHCLPGHQFLQCNIDLPQ